MIMDIVAGVIVIFSTILGAKKGFTNTVVSFLQWFVCIVLGFLLCGKLKDILILHTTFDDLINQNIFEKLSASVEASSAYQAVPDLFSPWMTDTTGSLARSAAGSITSIILTVISFLVIIFGVKLIAYIMYHSFSKKYHHGILGFFDGLAGFALGAIRGVIYVLLAFAILVPLLGFIWPQLSIAVTESFDSSYFAGYLYDNNFLLIIVRNILT